MREGGVKKRAETVAVRAQTEAANTGAGAEGEMITDRATEAEAEGGKTHKAE